MCHTLKNLYIPSYLNSVDIFAIKSLCLYDITLNKTQINKILKDKSKHKVTMLMSIANVKYNYLKNRHFCATIHLKNPSDLPQQTNVSSLSKNFFIASPSILSLTGITSLMKLMPTINE